MIARPPIHPLGLELAWLLALVSWLLCAPRAASAQDTLTTLPASLLKRVAAVADGQGVANRVFVVVSRTFPHEVAGVFGTRAEAEARARRVPDLLAFGPLQPTGDSTVAFDFIPKGCTYDGSLSYYLPAYCPATPVVPRQDVLSVIITTRMKDGRSLTATYSGDSVDAVFFTVDAMDRFVFHHFSSLFGAAYAANMRREFMRRLVNAKR